MSLVRHCVIDNIGFDLDGRGDIAVRIAKCTSLDGELLKRDPHRFLLQAGDDVDSVMAQVNAHLVSMGFEAVPAEDVDNLKAQTARSWTAARVAARVERDRVSKELVASRARIVGRQGAEEPVIEAQA